MRRRLLIAIALLTGGCGFWGGAPSPEAAVEGSIQRLPQRVLAGPAIRLMRPVEDGAVVLFTYTTEEQGQRMRWSAVQIVQRRLGMWRSVAGGGGGTSDQAPLQPIEYGIGSGGSAAQQYLYAYGLVNDPAVLQIAVTFPDGRREVVPVENGAYLAIRRLEAGQAQPGQIFAAGNGPQHGVRIEALDAQGKVLYTNQP
ncbi:hypothetical protein [Kallotenue papyrolyticum]|uniref:hypothetical protein n=1 Tax=Kallotenue papyrolyticum TaxID=1325125 RepID=UPI0004927420|nr:hypothetical protein [Kallotenue papyrolyticum]